MIPGLSEAKLTLMTHVLDKWGIAYDQPSCSIAVKPAWRSTAPCISECTHRALGGRYPRLYGCGDGPRQADSGLICARGWPCSRNACSASRPNSPSPKNWLALPKPSSCANGCRSACGILNRYFLHKWHCNHCQHASDHVLGDLDAKGTGTTNQNHFCLPCLGASFPGYCCLFVLIATLFRRSVLANCSKA